MQFQARHRDRFPIPTQSSGFPTRAWNPELLTVNPPLSPLFVVFAAYFTSKSFIYRFYAESLANPFIYRIYANTPGVAHLCANSALSASLCCHFPAVSSPLVS
jgi:hypothetical protein